MGISFPTDRGLLPIALIIGQLGQGGSERQLFAFLRQCDRHVWSPVLYVSGELGYWERHIRDLGIPIVLLKGSRLAKMHQFRAAVQAQQAVVIFSWSSYTNVFAHALIGFNVYRLGSFRNSGFSDLPIRGRALWTWASVTGLDVAICNSVETKHQIYERYPRLPVRYFPNGVTIPGAEELKQQRSDGRKAFGLSESSLAVLGVGRLTKQKRMDRFIKVIAAVRRTFPVQAVVAGPDMGCLGELQALVSELGLNDSVRFIGAVPDARTLMPAFDLLLMTSDHEGMPNVVLEAMAAGVPPVVTPVNGISELIEDGVTGLLSSTWDVEELAAKVVRLIEEPTVREEIGKRARATVKARHKEEDVYARLWSVCAGIA